MGYLVVMVDKVGRTPVVAESDGSFAGGGRTTPHPTMTVATEVWVVTALLHREHPGRVDFTTREIMARASEARICGPLRSGFSVHVNQHCVANRPPNPARLRMLFETGKGRRRLFRPGDPCHPRREGGRTMPDRTELPEEHRYLLDWYLSDYAVTDTLAVGGDPILALRGLGKELASEEHPDDFVRRLREGWQ